MLEETLRRVRYRVRTAALRKLLAWSPKYRAPARRLLRALGLEGRALRGSRARRLLLTPDEPRYQAIFGTRPVRAGQSPDSELFMLLCERDMLRGLWALKSFVENSGLDSRLVIVNDGTLSAKSIGQLRHHLPGCKLLEDTGDQVRAALAGYPMCLRTWKAHPISRKLFETILLARAPYALVMDSDILWYRPSPQIARCVAAQAPFFMDGAVEIYARNGWYLRDHCGFQLPAHCNSGLIGFPVAGFGDLDFLEDAAEKLVNVPPELLDRSLGLQSPSSVSWDPKAMLSWGIMEQTLFALLIGRCDDTVVLDGPRSGARPIHSFGTSPATNDTAAQHFVSDQRANAFLPVGAEYLIASGFLDRLGAPVPRYG